MYHNAASCFRQFEPWVSEARTWVYLHDCQRCIGCASSFLPFVAQQETGLEARPGSTHPPLSPMTYGFVKQFDLQRKKMVSCGQPLSSSIFVSVSLHSSSRRTSAEQDQGSLDIHRSVVVNTNGRSTSSTPCPRASSQTVGSLKECRLWSRVPFAMKPSQRRKSIFHEAEKRCHALVCPANPSTSISPYPVTKVGSVREKPVQPFKLPKRLYQFLRFILTNPISLDPVLPISFFRAARRWRTQRRFSVTWRVLPLDIGSDFRSMTVLACGLVAFSVSISPS